MVIGRRGGATESEWTAVVSTRAIPKLALRSAPMSARVANASRVTKAPNSVSADATARSNRFIQLSVCGHFTIRPARQCLSRLPDRQEPIRSCEWASPCKARADSIRPTELNRALNAGRSSCPPRHEFGQASDGPHWNAGRNPQTVAVLDPPRDALVTQSVCSVGRRRYGGESSGWRSATLYVLSDSAFLEPRPRPVTLVQVLP